MGRVEVIYICLLAVLTKEIAATCADGDTAEVVAGTSCKQFKLCSSGQVLSCLGDYIFVSSLGVCQSSAEHSCEDGPSCKNGVKPNPDDCASFINCATNAVIDCMENYHFDINTYVCRPNTLATCYEGSDNDVPNYIKLQCASVGQGTFISNANCSQFYICNGAVIEVASCPAGKHFSIAYNGCVPVLYAGCRTLGTMCIDEDTGYQFPGYDCSQYYTCPANGVPVASTCSGTQVFDPNTNACSSTYNCQNDIYIPGQSPQSPPTEGTTVGGETTTTASSYDPNAICAKTANGIKIKNPSDCNKYYLCNNGSAIPLVCNTGQNFSESNQYCDVNNPCPK